MAQQIHTAWFAFLQGHAPAAAGLPTWPRYTNTARATMLLDTTSRVVDQPQEAELRLWEGVL
jgi:para-nitrobenzyl esterase